MRCPECNAVIVNELEMLQWAIDIDLDGVDFQCEDCGEELTAIIEEPEPIELAMLAIRVV